MVKPEGSPRQLVLKLGGAPAKQCHLGASYPYSPYSLASPDPTTSARTSRKGSGMDGSKQTIPNLVGDTTESTMLLDESEAVEYLVGICQAGATFARLKANKCAIAE